MKRLTCIAIMVAILVVPAAGAQDADEQEMRALAVSFVECSYYLDVLYTIGNSAERQDPADARSREEFPLKVRFMGHTLYGMHLDALGRTADSDAVDAWTSGVMDRTDASFSAEVGEVETVEDLNRAVTVASERLQLCWAKLETPKATAIVDRMIDENSSQLSE